jgi:hypothetical protein
MFKSKAAWQPAGKSALPLIVSYPSESPPEFRRVSAWVELASRRVSLRLCVFVDIGVSLAIHRQSVLQLQRCRTIQAERLQGAAPREDFVQHGGHRRLSTRGRFEHAEVLEVGEQ